MEQVRRMIASGEAGRAGLAWLENLRLAAAAWWPMLALLTVFAAGHAWVMARVPPARPFSLLDTMLIEGSILAIVFVAWKMFTYARSGAPESPLRDFGDFLGNPARLLNAVLVLGAFLLFTMFFTGVKGAIPHLNPYEWDMAFMRLDRAIHGQDPWRILMPLLGHPLVMFIVNVLYDAWFLFVLAGIGWVAFARRHTMERMRYLLAFMSVWILGGNVLAIVFSSAGPAFYGNLVSGTDPYAPLMDYLWRVNETWPIWSLEVQKGLWRGYETKQAVMGGMSAFPSLHNAMAVLMAIASWKHNRILGMIMSAYAACIFIGSIGLGWHYAVDGYAGAVIAAVCWIVAGWIAAWMKERPETRRYQALLERLDTEKAQGCAP